jgi:hypothetical protein
MFDMIATLEGEARKIIGANQGEFETLKDKRSKDLRSAVIIMNNAGDKLKMARIAYENVVRLEIELLTAEDNRKYSESIIANNSAFEEYLNVCKIPPHAVRACLPIAVTDPEIRAWGAYERSVVLSKLLYDALQSSRAAALAVVNTNDRVIAADAMVNDATKNLTVAKKAYDSATTDYEECIFKCEPCGSDSDDDNPVSDGDSDYLMYRVKTMMTVLMNERKKK